MAPPPKPKAKQPGKAPPPVVSNSLFRGVVRHKTGAKPHVLFDQHVGGRGGAANVEQIVPVDPAAAATTPLPGSSENPKRNFKYFRARRPLPAAETTDRPEHESPCVSPEGREMAIPRMKVR